jgi:3-isopropylmalate dehydrogenase
VPPSLTPAERRDGDWLDCVVEPGGARRACAPLIGALPGEGVGPEVVAAALKVLSRMEEEGGRAVDVEFGGAIGREAERESGSPLPDDVVRFCQSVFDRGGAVLNGPGGGRYVYELRRRLRLFFKLTPVQARTSLPDASPLKPETLEDVDLLIVRENLGGVYQGRSSEHAGEDGRRRVRHEFSDAEDDVRRFLDAAARLAGARDGRLTVVAKEAGVPGTSALWRECAMAAAEAHAVDCSMIDVDLMAYRLVASPREFDVVAASNLCGDVLSDLGAVLLGTRALSFSGNFTTRGEGVYQTNHGAAYDLAGSDRANPAGQLLSLAMLLRLSLGMEREAEAIEAGIRRVWSEGGRTADLGAGNGRALGTGELAALVAEAAADHLGRVLDPA